jgi:addiction module RelE/StbE family toxin
LKKLKIKVSPAADEDMQSCFEYICDKLYNPRAALNLIDKVEHMYSLLEENPYMGTEHITESGKSYRFVMVKKYMMFYTVEGGVIDIRRFLYGASRYDSQLDKT